MIKRYLLFLQFQDRVRYSGAELFLITANITVNIVSKLRHQEMLGEFVNLQKSPRVEQFIYCGSMGTITHHCDNRLIEKPALYYYYYNFPKYVSLIITISR